MRTIGRKWRGPRGSYPARCSYCGVIWPSDKLVKDRAGMLACPDDRAGRDVVTLSIANAKAAKRGEGRPPPPDGMTMDRESPAIPIPPYTPP